MKVIGIIATKNRFNLFSLAIESAVNQTRQLDELIVVTDSEISLQSKEKALCDKYNAILLTDRNTHNYAGSLNTALFHIIEKNCINNRHGLEDIFISFLDDDDVWHSDYIESCCGVIKSDTDFVVSGINYCTENGVEQLNIPTELDLQDFLKSNPHIQGSNTFVRLTTLLMAGAFDENLSSTTDRDLFSRLMMLHPKFEVVYRHLVDVNAFNNRERITNGKQKKAEGLAKFYYKYSGFMKECTKIAFFKRANDYFGVKEESIVDYYKNQTCNINIPNYNLNTFSGRLVIGYIATDYDLGYRLLEQLVALKRYQTKIVILINFEKSICEYQDLLMLSKYEYELIDKSVIKNNTKDKKYGDFVNLYSVQDTVIKDIAIARTILQTHLYNASIDGDVIWVLDDDMELKELVYLNKAISERPVNIDAVIPQYIDKYDAVIGNYSLDPPLPTMSTLRTSLLDYMYTVLGNKNHTTDKDILFSNDYYYDLTDSDNRHLETPISINNNCSLKKLFSGKAQSRKLFVATEKLNEVKCRGGNTLIFNRELLLIPNISIKLGDNIGRRSDYFWTLLARQRGYNLINAPFALFHNRKEEEFDYSKEMHKLLLDIIGSSFTKTIEELGTTVSRRDFYNCFCKISTNRLNKFIFSYYRILGLLKILGSTADSFAVNFSVLSLMDFVRRFDALLDDAIIMPAYDTLCSNVAQYSTIQNRDEISYTIEKTLQTCPLRLLGTGSEALVFCDEKYVYKYFISNPVNINFLKQISQCFNNHAALYPLEFLAVNNHLIIKYKYESSDEYRGDCAIQFAKLLQFGKDNGFVFTNIKKDNFIVVNGQIKLIDYGKSIAPYDEEIYERSIERAYQLIRYYFISTQEFKQIITKSYEGKAASINAGLNLFRMMVEPRYKEDLHDRKVIELIKDHTPQKILDYGAGKCKIANKIANNYDTSVFDIDINTINERADKNVKILNSIDNLADDSFDLINSNLVLCSIETTTVDTVMSNMTRLLSIGGHLIVSICNPHFNGIANTELRTQGLSTDYHDAATFKKHNKIGAPVRIEYHRPIEFYTSLFKHYGYQIDNIVEGDGIDCDNVLPIAEHLFFDCRLLVKPKVLQAVSLLIKTNPMEHKNIYDNICHIVSQLEKGVRFTEKIVVVDCETKSQRARKYDTDDLPVLQTELERLVANGFVDRIEYAPSNSLTISDTYRKFFGIENANPHCVNGQGIFATLYGFCCVKTKYVFQTDSDILYYSDSPNAFADFIYAVKKSNAVSSSISIAHSKNNSAEFGTRVEVRSCLINLSALAMLLPLHNEIIDGQLQLPWHRALDEKTLGTKMTMRAHSNSLYFIHPQNDKKMMANYISTARVFIESGFIPTQQLDIVDIIGNRSDWHNRATAEVVLFLRGYNTSPSKLKRLFDSLRKQTYQNFQIIYVDDASTNNSNDYARFILRYEKTFSYKTIALFNDTNIGCLENFDYAMTNIATNPDSIIINIDNDDFLVDDTAIETIVMEFHNGADLSVGGCIRYDKPIKRYAVESFDKAWERGGDNIWLHPKCFRRYLYDLIDKNDMKIDGEFVKVNTDFAFMLPLVEVAKKPVVIDKILYYFEPSIENIKSQGKYSEKTKQKIKNILLDKARRRYEKNNISNR